MFRSFEVRNFRCFSHLKIDSLARINLIAGKNNAGKTSLLEALYILGVEFDPSVPLQLNAVRGFPPLNAEKGVWSDFPFDHSIHGFDRDRTMTFSAILGPKTRKISVSLKVLQNAKDLNGVFRFLDLDLKKPKSILSPREHVGRVLELYYEDGKKSGKHYLIIQSSGPPQTEPPNPLPSSPIYLLSDRSKFDAKMLASDFTRLEADGELEKIIHVLQIIEPRLKDIRLGYEADLPFLQGDLGTGHPVPLPLMGEGIMRITQIIIHILLSYKGVVLIDEIENGLHNSILPDLWRALGQAARENDVQIFLTTHSHECIEAAHNVFAKGKTDDFKFHRLDRVGDNIEAVTYSEGTLNSALELGVEVR